MNWLRNFLIGAILVVIFLLFIKWNDFQEKHAQLNQPVQDTLPSIDIDTPSISPEVSNTMADLPNDEIPSLPSANLSDQIAQNNSAQLIKITTDTLELLIDTKGGDIVKTALLNHYAKINEPENPYILLNRTQDHTYVAQSGLVGTNGTDSVNKRPVFSTKDTQYNLTQSQDSLVVDFNLQSNGANITKRFTFTRGSYLIDVEYIIENTSSTVWSGAIYGQIRRDSYSPPADTGIGMQPFLGAAITTPEKNYQKMSFSDIEDERFEASNTGGWIAMVQHYFIGAWIPDEKDTNKYKIRKLKNKDLYIFEYVGPLTKIAANSSGTIKTSFYSGPKTIKVLQNISPSLDLTADYSFLWFIAKPLFFGLDWFHSWVDNWGVAIILLTLLIKIVFFYPSAMSYRSMAKMRKLTPMMTELKERYGEDKQKMSTELMKLYKKEKVNPLGGCLPILLQMPVFISLYWMIMESVELRHSPFIFWIQDLSIKDPYFILPLIMGITMYIQQKLNPTPPDPMQAKVMQMMPFFFTLLFMFFPAGLVLYWVVNNALSISQQWVITRQIENEPATK